MTDSLDTSDREAEDPREPIRLPVREMRAEPVPHQAADPLRAALQLALEAKPEELPAALSAVRAALAAQQAGVQVPPGLKERCVEILEWQRTGVLTGRALRDFAASKYPNDPHALQMAEADTAREAYRALTAAPEAPAQANGTWRSHDANDTMRHPEQSDLIGGETDQPRAPMRHINGVREDLLRRAGQAQPTQAEAPSEREADDDEEPLKPCPFCGSDAEVGKVPQGHEDAGGVFVCCKNPSCAASSALIFPLMDDVQRLLVERWNRRAALASQPQAEDAENSARYLWLRNACPEERNRLEHYAADALDAAIDAAIDAARRAGGAG